MFEKPVFLKLVQLGLDKPGSAPFPKRLEPMLPVLGSTPFTDPDWLMEAKWDGLRVLAFVHDGGVKLRLRNGQDVTARFHPVANRLRSFPTSLVLDGEMVVQDERGHASLEAVETWKGRRGTLSYKVFDCLYLNGHSLLARPLEDRQRILQALQQALNAPAVQVTPALEGVDGRVAFQTAVRLGLEGLVAKRRKSPYRPGTRSSDWMKIPARPRQEFLVAGYFLSRRYLTGLVVGERAPDGKLAYVGTVDAEHAGDELRSDLLTRLRELERKRCPLATPPTPDNANGAPAKSEARWVKPEVLVEVEFKERTASGLRQAVLKGARDDKA
jgi:bifunctional non-homologous end joining protein LigD